MPAASSNWADTDAISSRRPASESASSAYPDAPVGLGRADGNERPLRVLDPPLCSFSPGSFSPGSFSPSSFSPSSLDPGRHLRIHGIRLDPGCPRGHGRISRPPRPEGARPLGRPADGPALFSYRPLVVLDDPVNQKVPADRGNRRGVPSRPSPRRSPRPQKHFPDAPSRSARGPKAVGPGGR